MSLKYEVIESPKEVKGGEKPLPYLKIQLLHHPDFDIYHSFFGEVHPQRPRAKSHEDDAKSSTGVIGMARRLLSSTAGDNEDIKGHVFGSPHAYSDNFAVERNTPEALAAPDGIMAQLIFSDLGFEKIAHGSYNLLFSVKGVNLEKNIKVEILKPTELKNVSIEVDGDAFE